MQSDEAAFGLGQLRAESAHVASYLVALLTQDTAEKVSAAARLHRHRAGRQLGAKPDNAVLREPTPKDDSARLIETRDAAAVLAEIDTQLGDRHRSLFSPDHVSLAPTAKDGRAIPQKTAHAAEQDRSNVKAAREASLESQPASCSSTSPGHRPIWPAPAGAPPRQGAALARAAWTLEDHDLRCRAVPVPGIAAPFALDGPISRDAFQAYVDRVLVPELFPRDIVVMDNLGSRKSLAVQTAIEALGTRLLLLAPYGSEFNPIKRAFSKLKALLRKAAERTVERLWSAIGRLTNSVTPGQRANFFATAGYKPD